MTHHTAGEAWTRRAPLIAVTAMLAVVVTVVHPAAATAACDYPSQVVGLSNWKLTLPTGTAGSPTEVKQPQLATYPNSPWFTVVPACNAVQFRAPVNGVTTIGSSYPRSELREMTKNGTDPASWSSTEGTHTMVITQAINKVPAGKPHVVAGQVHDALADISTLRLEGTRLYITNGNDTHYKLITARYSLGKPFQLRYVVSEGQVRAYYNGILQATISKSFAGAYFKAGAYPQANCTNSAPCDSTNAGQVVIFGVSVTHS
ncbi:MAG: polysaccharide lyase family 7 protein [Actinomycetota bacterium]|nr:polysaccharide lyase family 7 protein [Actinomycetota bacterium]